MKCSKYIGFEDPKVIKLSAATIGITLMATLCIASYAGVGLMPPTTRVFVIIGFYSAIPMLFVLFVYFFHFLMTKKLGNPSNIKHLQTDIVYIALLGLAFYLHMHLKAWVPLLNSENYDDFYWRGEFITRHITDAFLPARFYLSKLGEFDEFYQTGYVSVFMLIFGFIMIARRDFYHRYFLALLIMISFGWVTYYITPTIGPFLYEVGHNDIANNTFPELLPDYNNIREHGAEWFNVHGAPYIGAALSAVPSFHVAFCFMAIWGVWNCTTSYILRSVSVLFLLFVILESVWTKWHYFIDAPAGIAVALVSILIMRKILGEEPQSRWKKST